MHSLKYEIAPAYTVRVGDSVCEADGYSFEVTAIREEGEENETIVFDFAPQGGITKDISGTQVDRDANVRIFRKVADWMPETRARLGLGKVL
jgi:hypothetical protein